MFGNINKNRFGFPSFKKFKKNLLSKDEENKVEEKKLSQQSYEGLPFNQDPDVQLREYINFSGLSPEGEAVQKSVQESKDGLFKFYYSKNTLEERMLEEDIFANGILKSSNTEKAVHKVASELASFLKENIPYPESYIDNLNKFLMEKRNLYPVPTMTFSSFDDFLKMLIGTKCNYIEKLAVMWTVLAPSVLVYPDSMSLYDLVSKYPSMSKSSDIVIAEINYMDEVWQIKSDETEGEKRFFKLKPKDEKDTRKAIIMVDQNKHMKIVITGEEVRDCPPDLMVELKLRNMLSKKKDLFRKMNQVYKSTIKPTQDYNSLTGVFRHFNRAGNSNRLFTPILNSLFPFARVSDSIMMKKDSKNPYVQYMIKNNIPFGSGLSGMLNLSCRIPVVLVNMSDEDAHEFLKIMSAFVVNSGMHTYYEVYEAINLTKAAILGRDE